MTALDHDAGVDEFAERILSGNLDVPEPRSISGQPLASFEAKTSAVVAVPGPTALSDNWDTPPPSPPDVGLVPGLEFAGQEMGLLYRGRTNVVFGEPGVGKTIFAMLSVVSVVRSGGKVLYLDFENGEETIRNLFKSLGGTREEAASVGYWDAVVPLVSLVSTTFGDRGLNAVIGTATAVDLIILDGVGQSIHSAGGDENSNQDCQLWDRKTLRPLLELENNPAILCVDHVGHQDPKVVSKRRGSRGGSAKLGDARGHVMRFDLTEPFSRVKAGRFNLVTTKCRPGHFTINSIAATGTVTPTDHGETLTVALAPHVSARDAAGVFWPSILMGKAMALLSDKGDWVSTSQVQASCGGKSREAGEVPPIQEALRRLVDVELAECTEVKPGQFKWRATDKEAPSSFAGWNQGPPAGWEDDPF